MKTQIVKTRAGGQSGYSVAVLFSLDMGESYERLTHHMVFQDRHAAERLAERIKKAVYAVGPYCAPTYALDLDQWLWQPDCASYDGRLQIAPKAVPVFRPSTMLVD